MSKKIFICGSNMFFREGLHLLINSYSDMEVIGEAVDGKTAEYMIGQLFPDVVIVDINLPDLKGIDRNGIKTIRRITSGHPHVKVIAFLMNFDKQIIAKIFKAGASGYLLKNCRRDDVERIILEVVNSNISLSPKRIDTYLNILYGANGNV